MMWTAFTVVMFISTSVAAQGEGATSNDEQQGAGNNAFLTNYGSILKELHTCAAPSENMFIRPKQQDGTPLPSEFDKFCYYLASRDNVALYLCQYYKMIVENYFGSYCKDTDKLKRLDTSAQYQSWLQDPSKACKMLQQTVLYQKRPVFPFAESCEAICQQSIFCTNLAYLLSMQQTVAPSSGSENSAAVDASGNNENPASDSPNSENENPAEDTAPSANEISRGTKSANETKGTEEEDDQLRNDSKGGSEGEESRGVVRGMETPGTKGTDGNENPVVENSEDGIHIPPPVIGDGDGLQGGIYNIPPPAIGDSAGTQDGNALPPSLGEGEPKTSSQGEPKTSSQGGLFESTENEEAEETKDKESKDEEELKESTEIEDTKETEKTEEDGEKGVGSSTVESATSGGNISLFIANEDNGNIAFLEDEEEEESLSSDVEDSGPESFEQNLVPGGFHEEVVQDASKNVVPVLVDDKTKSFQKEMKILEEEEAGSHFLAYSLTAIILIMVTYILYHNKQKIVAIIIEGRNAPGGKRRRLNQNVYTAVDEMA